ncbi:MAG TPA: RcpC/CpaB family pilus assembly protein [Acidimicrobiales bacterium]|nr:RcpC/CpaB family pilus assembly protein [Acidimicrobiales bacterium]
MSEPSALSIRGSASANGAAPQATTASRAIRRQRSLPSGRALTGGFLVALASLGIFLAWSSAAKGPTTRYLVAARDLPIGSQVGPGDVDLVPMDLPGRFAAEVAFTDPAELAEAEVVNPIRAGDLLQASSLAAAAPGTARLQMSFSVPRDRAVGGTLRAGQFVDIVATFGTGAETYTTTVLQGARLLDIATAGDEFGSSGALTVTIAVADAEEARIVAHAVDGGKLTLVRSFESPEKAQQGRTYGNPPSTDG